VDLLFPHHENEIAQSECCNGTTFARHWYHTEHLLVEGTTMSRSKGNYYVLDDLVAKGYSPMAVRYALLMGHPRKQLNFTLDSLHAAESALDSLTYKYDLTKTYAKTRATNPSSRYDAVFEALREDLNIPAALGALFTIANSMRLDSSITPEDLTAFERVMFVLGLEIKSYSKLKADVPAQITALAEKRWAAKQAKDFAGADALRKELTAAGWSMLDGKDGYKLEKLKG
jgi:cysteinyl-tRNA synthetase